MLFVARFSAARCDNTAQNSREFRVPQGRHNVAHRGSGGNEVFLGGSPVGATQMSQWMPVAEAHRRRVGASYRALISSTNSMLHGDRLTSNRATVIGKLNRRGPALPGLM